MDRRLIAVCEALTDEALNGEVRFNRITRVQVERADRLLMHLFQHQIHHRGQAHAMLAGTAVKPPQLDEFFSVGEADLRAGGVREAGLDRGAGVGVRRCSALPLGGVLLRHALPTSHRHARPCAEGIHENSPEALVYQSWMSGQARP